MPELSYPRAKFSEEIQTLKNSIQEYLQSKRRRESDKGATKRTKQKTTHRSQHLEAQKRPIPRKSPKRTPAHVFLQESEQFLEEIMAQMDKGEEKVKRGTVAKKRTIASKKTGSGATNASNSAVSRSTQPSVATSRSMGSSHVVASVTKHSPPQNTRKRKEPPRIPDRSPDFSTHYDYTLKEIEQTFNIDTSNVTTRKHARNLLHSELLSPASDDQSLISSVSSYFSGDDDDTHSELSLRTQRLLQNSRNVAKAKSTPSPPQDFTKLSRHHRQETNTTAPPQPDIASGSATENLSREKPYVPPLRISQKNNSTTPQTISARRSSSARSTSRSRISARSSLSARRRKPLQNHFSSQELVSIISKTLKAKKAEETQKQQVEEDNVSIEQPLARSSLSPQKTKRTPRDAGRFRTLNLSSLLDELGPPHKRKTHALGTNQVTYALKETAPPASGAKPVATKLATGIDSLANELLKKRHRDMKEPVVHLRPSGKLTKGGTNGGGNNKSSTTTTTPKPNANQRPLPSLLQEHHQDEDFSVLPTHQATPMSNLAESLGLINAHKHEINIPSVDELIASVLKQGAQRGAGTPVDASFTLDEEETNVEISVLSKSPGRSLKSSLKKTKPVNRKKSVSWDYSIDADQQHEDEASEEPMHDGLGEDEAEHKTEIRTPSPPRKLIGNWTMSDDSTRKMIYPPSFSMLLDEKNTTRSDKEPGSNGRLAKELSASRDEHMETSFREADAYINRIRVLRAYLNTKE